jgi:capsid protein
MNAKSYSPRSIESYVREMRLLFSHYNDLPPKSITQNDIVNYINFIKIEHGVSRDKCRMTAQSCSFFYKHIYKAEFILPTPAWIDPLKEAEADEVSVSYGLASYTEVLKARGKDRREVLRQKVTEVKEAIETAKQLEEETETPVDWKIFAGLKPDRQEVRTTKQENKEDSIEDNNDE